MPNLSSSIVKIERSVIHQILSILQNKSIGVLKNPYGHHPWSQGCTPCIRKTFSGTFLIVPQISSVTLISLNWMMESTPIPQQEKTWEHGNMLPGHFLSCRPKFKVLGTKLSIYGITYIKRLRYSQILKD